MLIFYRESLGVMKIATFVNIQENRAFTPLEPVAQQHYGILRTGWDALQVNTENKAMKIDTVTNAIEHTICGS
jgi:hypothetical protein